MKSPEEKTIQNILIKIEKLFYSTPNQQRCYYQDKRMLIYTITWPAEWMRSRGLQISQPAYEKLIIERLEQIAEYGNQQAYQKYFPRYLLKCIQNWFQYNGNALYEKLKHIRDTLILIKLNLHPADSVKTEQQLSIEMMSQAHRLIKNKPRKKKDHTKQTEFILF